MNFTGVIQWKIIPQCKGKTHTSCVSMDEPRNIMPSEGRKPWKRTHESIYLMFKSRLT